VDLNDRAAMTRFLDLGADGIMDDEIETLREVLIERGQWVSQDGRLTRRRRNAGGSQPIFLAKYGWVTSSWESCPGIQRCLRRPQTGLERQ